MLLADLLEIFMFGRICNGSLGPIGESRKIAKSESRNEDIESVECKHPAIENGGDPRYPSSDYWNISP
jgi:hypothetical protein